MIHNGKRAPKTFCEVRLEKQWWKRYRWTEEVGRVVPEGQSMLTTAPVVLDKEVEVCMGNVVIEVGFLFGSDVGVMEVVKGLKV